MPDIADISRLLDNGFSGVICPSIVNAQQARDAVAAAKFPPGGRRGVAAIFPHYGYRSVPASVALPALNDASMVVLQIESLEGLNNVEAIAAVDGVDIVLVGTNDLLADMGVAGQFGHGKLRQAFARIAAACKDRSVAIGIGGLSTRPDLVASFVEMGGSFISAGSDVGFLANSARAKAGEFRTMEKT